MSFKIMLVLVIQCFCIASYGQSFKKDWTDFKPSASQLIFSGDTSRYINKPTQGCLVFANANGIRMAKYYVYRKQDVDSIFQKKIMEWFLIQSCLDMVNGKTNFTSFFDYKDYYYVNEPCQPGNMNFDNDCARELKGFILKK